MLSQRLAGPLDRGALSRELEAPVLALVAQLGVVDRLTVGAPMSSNVTTAGLYRNTTRMLPPDSPPSWSLTGSISRES